uniref:EMI domain-containing protein n=1 Tax=Oryzias latipes TaxID=8090 RepID=A0A3B3HR75_ORYLA
MASNAGAIQSYSFDPDSSSDEENQDVHGSICLHKEASEWSGGGSLNWCPHTVTKTITCQVQNGTVLQRVYQTCRWPQGCSGGSYKTMIRPSYKVVHRTVTSLEWKCCPGFSGSACEEGKRNFFLFLPRELNPLPAHNRIPHCCQSHSALFFNSNKTLHLMLGFNCLDCQGCEIFKKMSVFEQKVTPTFCFLEV